MCYVSNPLNVVWISFTSKFAQKMRNEILKFVPQFRLQARRCYEVVPEGNCVNEGTRNCYVNKFNSFRVSSYLHKNYVDFNFKAKNSINVIRSGSFGVCNLNIILEKFPSVPIHKGQ